MSEKCEICSLPREICSCEKQALEQASAVEIVTENRKYGKEVTLIKGINAASVNLEELASKLKKGVGTGGTIKNGVIELQGNRKESRKLREILEEMGISIKR